ncbi:MAG: cytochrome c [Chloroflexi bacterium]|nr:cytochrome c [Chloroflexota bacterium]
MSDDKQAEKKRRRMLILAMLAVVALAAVGALAFVLHESARSEGTVTVKTTALSDLGKQGEALFRATCMECHGENGSGTMQGPPLVHIIYEPRHHSDKAFYLAVATGVRQHHWPYGDMPAQPQVSPDDVTKIIRFIRELQVANGIS